MSNLRPKGTKIKLRFIDCLVLFQTHPRLRPEGGYPKQNNNSLGNTVWF